MILYIALLLSAVMRKKTSPSIVSTIAILATSLAVITLGEFGIFGIAQSQGNSTLSLTPQQKAAMCNPNNPKLNFVNTTESKICGIPTTPTNTTSSAAANTTTTRSEAPSVTPPLTTPGS